MHHTAIHRASARALAATLALTIAASPALAQAVHVVSVRADGTFLPKFLDIDDGDIVEWQGLRRTDAVARLSMPAIQAAFPTGIDPVAVCADSAPDNPAYVHTASAYRQAFDGPGPGELTGPGRRGLSGIWALSPAGGTVSYLEIPSAEAEAIQPGITAYQHCDALDHNVPVTDDGATPMVEDRIKYLYTESVVRSGVAPAGGLVANPVTGPGGTHRLCTATAEICYDTGLCEALPPHPLRPETVPPGTYFNGLLTSTYENPDITGVVLRLSWKDLQYDDNRTIREHWQHLDRELERAVAHGKLVTFDVRAGMVGTPDWIFSDWRRADPTDQDDAHAAPWCPSPGPCAFIAAPPGAGMVEDLEFVDHYDRTPAGTGCGSPIRIGSPGDVHYRALYKGFIARLAEHVATDTRWWQAVAHVKASGANLLTSEAELPHSCDDEYDNQGDHQADPKTVTANAEGDRVLDVFKTELLGGERVTAACVCNPKIWFDAGYQPQQLYDYYAEVEQQILQGFFGEKSIGYQIIQDGFPRADRRPAGGGSFWGDHLYRELLVTANATVPPAATIPYATNAGFEAGDACPVLSVDPIRDPNAANCSRDEDLTTFLPEVEEDRANFIVRYCAADTAVAATMTHLEVEPLARHPLDPRFAEYPDDICPGDRYPLATEQSETVLDEAGNGRFTDLVTPPGAGHVDRIAGKLFVPQHSGVDPLPQERAPLGFDTPSDRCNQQRPTIDTAAAGWPAAIRDRVGPRVAGFPIPESVDATLIGDPLTSGCPLSWIVDQGKERDHAPFAPFALFPEATFPIDYPPQITGFQTTNTVRGIAHVESTLFNLTYNSNGVFLELYEDAVWTIGRSRGTGPNAITLDDPAAPERLATDPMTGAYLNCDPADQFDPFTSCYSKTLSQWSEELHLRRATIAAMWGTVYGRPFPGLENPFPTTYRKRFFNPSMAPADHAYINPVACQSGLVDLGPWANGQPSALGMIRVQP